MSKRSNDVVTDGGIFNRGELLEVLKSLKPGLADKEDAEQSKSFIFDNDRIFTFNDNVGVCVPFQSGIRCEVPSEPILAVLGKLKNDDIILSYSEGSLSVRQGKRVKVDITSNADIKLSFDENVKPPSTLTPLGFSPKKFEEGVKSVLFTVCSDTQTIQLCGIHVGSDSKGTFIESSDRFRLTRVYVSDKTDPISLKIPILTAQALCSLKPLEYAVHKGWLYFKCENDVQFASWTPKEKYPDLDEVYKGLIKSGKTVKVTFPTKIEGILDLAGDFAHDGASHDARVVVEVKDGKAMVSATGAYGSFKDLCKVESDGDTVFRIHPQALVEALAMSLTLDIYPNTLIVKGKHFWHVSVLDVHEKE